MSILSDCKAHSSVFVVTYDSSVLNKADRILQLRDGVLKKS